MQDYLGNVFVAVHPVEAATEDALMALGKVLSDLKAREPRITYITGIEELLEGRYPPPWDTHPIVPDSEGEITIPSREGKFSIPEPWKYCPAVVKTHDRELAEEELATLLRQKIPPELGEIVVNFGGY